MSHSVYDAGAEFREIVSCNRAHIHGIETAPQGQGCLAIMYYNGLHLSMQFIKPSKVTVTVAIFHIVFLTRCLPSGIVCIINSLHLCFFYLP